jgi:hypothetical protein
VDAGFHGNCRTAALEKWSRSVSSVHHSRNTFHLR